MQLLSLYQGETRVDIGLFDTLEEGRDFASKMPGYTLNVSEEGFVEETIDPEALPVYAELSYKGHLFPMTRYSFLEDEVIYVDWTQLPVFSKEGEGLVQGCTKVDAYHVDHAEVKAYIQKREGRYAHIKQLLQARGCEVQRAYAGSEDGEAIIYRQGAGDDWHFLTHMDPSFVEEEVTDEAYLEYLDA